MSNELALYHNLLADIKVRVRTAQHKAALSANAEMILMYWDIGRMIAFYRAYPNLPQPAAKLQSVGFEPLGILQQAVAKLGSQAPPLLQNPENESAVIGPQPVAQLTFAMAPIVQRSVAQIPRGRKISAPTVRHMPAQGNALGPHRKWIQALKGRPKTGVPCHRARPRISRPFRARSSFVRGSQGAALGWHGLPLWGARVPCAEAKDRILAEYSIRDIHKPIGVADYELTRALPEEFASSLPSIEAIEEELSRDLAGEKLS